jgi:1-acyl-sn-glycerol-3-phosphate acyltransferase
MHKFILTQGFTVDDKKAIRDKAWDVIYKELVASENAK